MKVDGATPKIWISKGPWYTNTCELRHLLSRWYPICTLFAKLQQTRNMISAKQEKQQHMGLLCRGPRWSGKNWLFLVFDSPPFSGMVDRSPWRNMLPNQINFLCRSSYAERFGRNRCAARVGGMMGVWVRQVGFFAYCGTLGVVLPTCLL